MEDGHRVFAELAPHPLLTHPLEQNARSLDIPLAALASMRREQEMPHGLRGFLADLHNAGAAVDFSALYPNGRLVDAPLPTWTHRRLLLNRDGQESSPTHGACTVSVHPLLGPHVRLQEEPERHVWQGEVGTAAQPWLGDHQIRNVAVLPGAAYCEMALAAARAVLGEASEVRDIRFEQALLLDEQTTVGASASVSSPDRPRLHRRDESGGRARAASCRSPACRRRTSGHLRTTRRRSLPRIRIARMAPRCATDWTSVASSTVRRSPVSTPCTPARGQAPQCWPRSRSPAKSARNKALTACTQRCWMPVSSPSRLIRTSAALGEGVLGLPLGVRRLRSYTAARDAHYCYTRVTKADTSGIEADIDVLDEHGRSPARRAGAAIGHQRLGERQQRSGAGRAAADHRMAATRTARRGIRRRRVAGC